MDMITDLIDFELFGYPFVYYLAALAVITVVMTLKSKLEATKDKKKKEGHFRKVQCDRCHWTGVASTHKPVCGKCGSSSLTILRKN